LGGEDGEFGFGEVEPASVLGRVTPFEPLNEAAGFGGWKGLVERGRRRAHRRIDRIAERVKRAGLVSPGNFG